MRLDRPDDKVVYDEVVNHDCYRIDDLFLPVRPVIVDIGAHVGCFVKHCYDKWPDAIIYAAECCPENIPILRENVGSVCEIVPYAVTYEKGQMALLNTCIEGGPSTCGSEVLPVDTLLNHQHNPNHYWRDLRPLKTITLDEIVEGRNGIDLLKLDCEGSEFSILRNARCTDAIRFIVGEWHGKSKFQSLIRDRFRGWKLEIFRDADNGLFKLTNPKL